MSQQKIDNPSVKNQRFLTAPLSVTPQKFEPTAMDFWLVERMHASAASRYTGEPLNGVPYGYTKITAPRIRGLPDMISNII